MAPAFEELDYQQTPLGELILRRRRSAAFPDTPLYEVKLAGAFLMSSLVNDTEVALARLALADRSDEACDVLVGGLGLGCTAATALEYAQVRRVVVLERLAPVIDWHRRGLVPLGERLAGDPRCRLVEGDFFAWAAGETTAPELDEAFDAVMVDIDHSPRCLLTEAHADFYQSAGLERLRRRVKPGGVFTLWSADPPDDAFAERLERLFNQVDAHDIAFFNPLLNRRDHNTVYRARA